MFIEYKKVFIVKIEDPNAYYLVSTPSNRRVRVPNNITIFNYDGLSEFDEVSITSESILKENSVFFCQGNVGTYEFIVTNEDSNLSINTFRIRDTALTIYFPNNIILNNDIIINAKNELLTLELNSYFINLNSHTLKIENNDNLILNNGTIINGIIDLSDGCLNCTDIIIDNCTINGTKNDSNNSIITLNSINTIKYSYINSPNSNCILLYKNATLNMEYSNIGTDNDIEGLIGISNIIFTYNNETEKEEYTIYDGVTLNILGGTIHTKYSNIYFSNTSSGTINTLSSSRTNFISNEATNINITKTNITVKYTTIKNNGTWYGWANNTDHSPSLYGQTGGFGIALLGIDDNTSFEGEKEFEDNMFEVPFDKKIVYWDGSEFQEIE